eukprot:g8801.t1
MATALAAARLLRQRLHRFPVLATSVPVPVRTSDKHRKLSPKQCSGATRRLAPTKPTAIFQALLDSCP